MKLFSRKKAKDFRQEEAKFFIRVAEADYMKVVEILRKKFNKHEFWLKDLAVGEEENAPIFVEVHFYGTFGDYANALAALALQGVGEVEPPTTETETK